MNRNRTRKGILRRARRSQRQKRVQGGNRYLALDCEMVEGPGRRSMLAEVALVDWEGNKVYHAFVQPTAPVVNYRTNVSGITPQKLTAASGALPFAQVKREVQALLQDSILVGHALHNDLLALNIEHPPEQIRNTANHPHFKTMASRGQLQPQKLATLYSRYVGNKAIQEGSHSALEDARASMRLYRTHHNRWNEPVVHQGPILAPRPPFVPLHLRAPTSAAPSNTS